LNTSGGGLPSLTLIVMRRNRIVVISAVIGGIATFLLVVSLWPPRCPVKLTVVAVEPSTIFYFGEEEAMLVTLSVGNSDIVDVTYQIPTFEANVGGRWIEMQQVGGFSRMSAGAKREEKLVMPGGTICRVQLRYAPETWKSRFIVRIGPTGRTWVAKSPWLCKWVWPDQYESMRMPAAWKTNTVEIVIPRRDHPKPGAL
jgi:hypothetical protein